MSSQTSSRDDSTLIQIDTVEDWERLQQNFTDAIERTLDAQLGPTASLAARDALRQHLLHVSLIGTCSVVVYQLTYIMV